jgi:hypothetical protein
LTPLNCSEDGCGGVNREAWFPLLRALVVCSQTTHRDLSFADFSARSWHFVYKCGPTALFRSMAMLEPLVSEAEAANPPYSLECSNSRNNCTCASSFMA